MTGHAHRTTTNHRHSSTEKNGLLSTSTGDKRRLANLFGLATRSCAPHTNHKKNTRKGSTSQGVNLQVPKITGAYLPGLFKIKVETTSNNNFRRGSRLPNEGKMHGVVFS